MAYCALAGFVARVWEYCDSTDKIVGDYIDGYRTFNQTVHSLSDASEYELVVKLGTKVLQDSMFMYIVATAVIQHAALIQQLFQTFLMKLKDFVIYIYNKKDYLGWEGIKKELHIFCTAMRDNIEALRREMGIEDVSKWKTIGSEASVKFCAAVKFLFGFISNYMWLVVTRIHLEAHKYFFQSFVLFEKCVQQFGHSILPHIDLDVHMKTTINSMEQLGRRQNKIIVPNKRIF